MKKGLKRRTVPHPYQRESAYAIDKFNGRCLLALEMGLGKSLISLLWAWWNPEVRPIIIVCPASLKYNWEREASRHFGMSTEILSGTKPTRLGLSQAHQIVIINYDILYAWLPFLKKLKPKLIILDEIHYCKEGSARRTKCVKKLCKGVPHVICLSGTPLTNRPAELWTTVSLLRPDKYHQAFAFHQKYCDPELTPWGWKYNGATNLKDLHRKLKRHLMVRLRKKDVIDQLPPKIRTIVPVELSDRREYNHAVKDFIGWLSKFSRAKASRAARAQRLVKWAYLKQLIGQLKLKAVMDWIDNFLEESDGKLIVFGIHREILQKLHEKYGKLAVRVDGSVKGRDRQLAVDAFQNKKSIRLFLGNIKAAGVGLNLTAAHTVAFAELGWTPGEHLQAEDRCYARIGDMHGANVVYLIARETLEDKLIKLIVRKQKTLDQVLDGAESKDFDLMKLLEKELLEMPKPKTPKRRKAG